MTHEYTTRGTCSRKILFEVEDGKVHNVQFINGCSGNTQGVAKLCEGMDVNEVIDRLDGDPAERLPAAFCGGAHFRRCLASSLTKAFILFIFRFQRRYWEIQTTTKIAVKIPA